MSKVHISRIEEYEMYLKHKLAKYLNEPNKNKNMEKEEKLDVVIAHMMLAFEDGINFQLGRLNVEVDN